MKSIVTNFSHLSELKLQEMEISFYNPDENILGSIFMHDVEALYEKALNKLPEQCREIFVLSKQEDMKSTEIAFKLGVSVRTVENQIYRGIRIMREEMKEYALPVVMLLMMVKELF
jgi:RNA polymerase sigma-70 factor (ECF subfamily)